MRKIHTYPEVCGHSLPKEEYILLYLSDSKLTPLWFYKGLLDQLCVESKSCMGNARNYLQNEIEIIWGVHEKRNMRAGLGTSAGKETIEEFRFLLNHCFDSMNPLVLILVGQVVGRKALAEEVCNRKTAY